MSSKQAQQLDAEGISILQHGATLMTLCLTEQAGKQANMLVSIRLLIIPTTMIAPHSLQVTAAISHLSTKESLMPANAVKVNKQYENFASLNA